MIHEDQIRRLYVDERKSLSQVIAIMQAEHGLTIETYVLVFSRFDRLRSADDRILNNYNGRMERVSKT